jgi:hypothetical protein
VIRHTTGTVGFDVRVSPPTIGEDRFVRNMTSGARGEPGRFPLVAAAGRALLWWPAAAILWWAIAGVPSPVAVGGMGLCLGLAGVAHALLVSWEDAVPPAAPLAEPEPGPVAELPP